MYVSCETNLEWKIGTLPFQARLSQSSSGLKRFWHEKKLSPSPKIANGKHTEYFFGKVYRFEVQCFRSVKTIRIEIGSITQEHPRITTELLKSSIQTPSTGNMHDFESSLVLLFVWKPSDKFKLRVNDFVLWSVDLFHGLRLSVMLEFRAFSFLRTTSKQYQYAQSLDACCKVGILEH